MKMATHANNALKLTAEIVLQNEDITPEALRKPSQPKPKQTWKETTIYSLQKGAGQPPVTKVITKSGDGRHPKLSTTYSSHEPDRSKLLSNHLQQLLPGASSTQQGITGGEPVWPKGKLHYLSYLQPTQSNHADPQIAFGSNTAKPNLDRLLFKAGPNRLPAKDPHSLMDGRCSCFVAFVYRFHTPILRTWFVTGNPVFEIMPGAF